VGVAVASVFTLARFSEAFLVLRAQNVGLPIMLVPAVLVAMNFVYAVAAYPAGVISDRISRTAVLAGGILLLVAADIALALLRRSAALRWASCSGPAYGADARVTGRPRGGHRAGRNCAARPMDFSICSAEVAMLAASIIAGALWDITGPQGTFLAGAGFALIALAGLLMVHGKIGGKAARE